MSKRYVCRACMHSRIIASGSRVYVVSRAVNHLSFLVQHQIPGACSMLITKSIAMRIASPKLWLARALGAYTDRRPRDKR